MEKDKAVEGGGEESTATGASAENMRGYVSGSSADAEGLCEMKRVVFFNRC